MLINTFIILSLIASTSAEPQLGALIGKIAGKTSPKARPQDPPQLPSRPNGGKPQDPPPPPVNPGLAEAKAQVNNVAGLNKKWEQAETIADVADLGSSIAEAILGTAQTTTAVAIVLPGPVLCNWAISQSDFSMPSTLAPTTVSCAASTPTPTAPASAQVKDQGGEAARLLTASDLNMFAMLALLLTAFSGLFL
ncbi:hypothetical protein E8E11_005379 [Didymella keratinophila]|nr:hypothetical protein E8E11_005379 [Didymella keratinophila]